MKAGKTAGPETSRTFRLILAIAFSMLLLAGQANGQEHIDVGALLRETQITSRASNDLTTVWWLPEPFWQASLRQSKATVDQVEEVLKIVRRYTVIAIVDGRVGPFGGMSSVPKKLFARMSCSKTALV
jgi:hypothetical protein